MSWQSKVVWSEGMFLRPQHFQQFERYLEHLLQERAGTVRPHAWGLRELVLDQELLATGQISVQRCAGVMADGTPFRVPEDVPPPAPLRVPESTRASVVYLCLPVRQAGITDVAIDGEQAVTRFTATTHEAVDTTTATANAVTVQVGQLNLSLALEGADLSGYTVLGLVRIKETRADRAIVLDDGYIPPCLHCAASTVLTGYIEELRGALTERAGGLAGRAAEGGNQGVSEVADFMLLQAVNRYLPLFEHFGEVRELHPERLFAVIAQMAGEFATFFAEDRRAPDLPTYRHDDLAGTLGRVIDVLRQLFRAEFSRPAVPVPLYERKYGIRVGMPEDRTLLDDGAFVLAVRAEMPAERLRRSFPEQVKIGPVEDIRHVVNSALPGIPVEPLPVAPRQIPFHRGTSYFQLDASSSYWPRMRQSAAFAIFVPNDFPGLSLELWAIRS